MPNCAFETDAVQRCALHGAAQQNVESVEKPLAVRNSPPLPYST
jgi:hypothetical protein